MERLPNKTLLAEKLQEVSLPDAGEAWKTMAVILDNEMPAHRKKDRRRWLLLIILLLLLGGCGYFMWRGRPDIDSPVSAGDGKARAAGGKASTVGGNPGVAAAASKAEWVEAKSKKVDVATEGTGVDVAADLQHSDPGNIQPPGVPDRGRIAGPPLSVHSGDPLECPPVDREKTNGLVVGVGLNQAIPVDGQQIWTNPSGGLNQWWKDYIPVPFVRYYFKSKLFLQAEARFHAPQYTSKDLRFAYQYNDTTYSGLVWIKKLFYFQLPITIHYAPSESWNVGLGLQYSHYGKGIAAMGDSNYYSHIGPLSDYPMVFVKHSEFRGVVSLEYMYRHWVVGTSYDHAFTNAITVRVPDPVTAPQAEVIGSLPPVRNSSLQLYLRYILWDGRRKGGVQP